ncbi:S8 family serine peptidase [Lysobacter sp. 5GHs7-4]|uniref:S8 family serine peptidase n=1 Tax=Lysobacter sp. 5GHs7-4 TaxID=2904253 RepID=UPI001E413C52|nr:S8 family serine peptidase [Lysobacter sp. 5GHs7-4]UHQ24325.1 S8 family serine peptidase [Lysobacter sp. 5GHs7-4]
MSNSNNPLRVRTLTAATALALAAAAAPAFAGQAVVSGLKSGETYNQFIVKYKNGSAPTASSASVASSLSNAGARTVLPAASKGKKLGLRHLRRMAMGADVVVNNTALNSEEARAVIQQIAADPNVEWVQPDYIMRALAVPNDTRFGEQWHYADSAVGIRAPTAWNTTSGSGVVVAVIDSGIVSHTDLNANVLPGYDFVTSTTGLGCSGATDCGASEDGNGRDADPTDVSGATTGYHGSHVAGTIGAVTNNASGVAGVAHGAKIVPVRALAKHGTGSTSDIADAIVWASGGAISGVPANANPAEVINMSLGGDRPCSDTPAYQTAINTATANGSIVVAAAGNSNIDVAGSTPASCGNVVSVAASDQGGKRAWYSTYGAVSITAPGGETCSPTNEFLPLNRKPTGSDCTRSHPAQGVLSTINGNGYGWLQGTSMATPHVAGVVALIQAAASTPKTVAQVKQILADTARPISAANCPGGCGPGLMDAAAAVAAAGGGGNPNPNPSVQTYTNGTDANIPDNNTTGVSSSIAVAGRTGNAPADAKVSLSIVHTYRGDLKVDLIAPDGSVYAVFNGVSNDSGDNVTISNQSVNLSSEALNGTWKLRAVDRAQVDTGRIDSWSITF